MDYPRDFPEHLKRKVDAAIATAEIAWSKSLQNKHKQFGVDKGQATDLAIQTYVLPVFYAFAHQACEAMAKGHWNGELTRRRINEFRDSLIREAYFKKNPKANPSTHHTFWKNTLEDIDYDEEWVKIQERLKEVAEWCSVAPVNEDSKIAGARSRRGYSEQIHQWIEREGLGNVERAARRLGVSKSVLKSIMSTKGKMRYSQETLERVLKEIGCKPEG